jgi:hypothetical protein
MEKGFGYEGAKVEKKSLPGLESHAQKRTLQQVFEHIYRFLNGTKQIVDKFVSQKAFSKFKIQIYEKNYSDDPGSFSVLSRDRPG